MNGGGPYILNDILPREHATKRLVVEKKFEKQ